jgi:hypothetical protein
LASAAAVRPSLARRRKAREPANAAADSPESALVVNDIAQFFDTRLAR